MSDLAVITGADRQRVWEGEPPELVQLKLLYDAFAPSTVETHVLQWREGVTLADFMEGLPTEAEWMIFHNGNEVALADAANHPVAKGDQLGLLLVPQGRNGIKSVLKIVLMAAVVVVAAITQQWWVIAAVAIGAGVINTFLLSPRPGKSKNQDGENSYGIDGAKNSATEGIPYPVCYGEFRIGGNFSDCYTENVGDNQFLYLRSVLNDGLIEGVYDIELNEQPIANFSEITTRVALGSLTDGVNDWFNRSIVQKNKSVKIDTPFTYHVTTSAVDKVRFDVGFTQGLVSISEKKGTYGPRSVTFEFVYRALDPVTKQPIGDGSFHPLPMPGSNSGYGWYDGFSFKNALKFIVSAKAKLNSSASTTPTVQYREVGTSSWQDLGYINANEADRRGYAFDPSNDGSIAGDTDITPYTSATLESPDLDGDYEIRGINGAEIEAYQYVSSAFGNSITVTDQRTKQIRQSYESIQLPKGFYEVGIRRTTPTSTDKYQIDEVYLTDVAEIDTDQVAMRGTANLSIRARVNEQLNGIPNVTARVRGSVLQEYDIDGNPTVKRWSGNHAWVALDMLCGIERGAGLSTARIDWPAWLELAQYCTDNNLSFNGVFDEKTNLGDAVNEVLRACHAAPVAIGTKLSVIIDRPRKPVQAFTQANIIKGSFSIDYMSMSERANDFSVTFFDKNDKNKQKTIRYVDPKAVTFNEMPRQVSYTLRGCDNMPQAVRELWRMIYANRLIIRSVNLEASTDAISMVQGEVALIQHDMMDWANSGRLKSGSTPTIINLDQKVEKEAGKSYRALVHFDALQRATVTGSTVVGSKLMVTGPSIQNLSVKRLMIGTEDIEVLSMKDGATFHTIQLANAPTSAVAGVAITLWDTDVMEERDVTNVVQLEDGTSQVTLASPLPAAPDAYANFVYGELQNVRKPYVLVGMTGDGIEKRRLTFAEYAEGVYGPPEVDIPIPTTTVNDRIVSHVQALHFDYERLVEPGREAINTRVHWNPAEIRNYAGADVYMALNGSAMRPIGSAANVSEYHLTLKPNDVVEFMVVAYNTRGDRAPAVNAPRIKGSILIDRAELSPPTNLNTSTTSFDVDGKVLVTWAPPTDATGVAGYEGQWRDVDDSFWNSTGVIDALQFPVNALGVGTFEVRVRSVNGDASSPWVSKVHTIDAPPMTGAVTGLKVGDGSSNEFMGKDAIFSWADAARDKVYFLDYQVQIKTTAGTLLRTEYVATPHYTYTSEKNAQDSLGQPVGARGTFKIEVRQRGRQGQFSAPATLTVSNPAPFFPAAPTVTGVPNGINVNQQTPNDSDYAGMKVFMSLVDGFTPSAENLVYIGANNNVTLPALGAGAHYVVTQPFDTFGSTGGTTGQVSAVPTTFSSLITLDLSNDEVGVPAAADGGSLDLSTAFGQATVREGATDVTDSAAFSTGSLTNCTGSVNTATNTPVAGKPKGYYRVATMGGAGQADTAMMVVQATYAGLLLQKNFTLSKRKAGIAGASPALITLNTTSPVFKYDGAGNPITQTIVFTATRNSAASAKTTWKIMDGNGVSLATGDAATIATTSYFTRLNDDAISMTHTQFANFIGGSPERESFTVEVSSSGATDREGVSKVQNGANAKTLYVYSDRANIVYGSDGNIANPSQQTITFTIVPQNLTTGTYSISLFRSDGTQLNANSYLTAGAGYSAAGNGFTQTGLTFTLSAASFDAATADGYQGIYVQVSADGVADKQAVTKTQDGAKGSDGASAFSLEDVTNGVFGAPGSWTKLASSAGDWDGLVKTAESYVGSASVTCDFGTDIFVGLSTDWLYAYPTEDCFSRLDYALHISSGGNTAVYRNGALTATLGPNQPGQKPLVWSDGRNVHYTCGTLSYSHPVNAAGERLYGLFAMFHPGQSMTGIGFAAAGPAGNDGENAIGLTPSPAAVIVKTDAQGAVEDGTLPKSVQFTAMFQDSNVTAAATWSDPIMTDCTVANLGGGLYRVDGIAADEAEFTVTCTYLGRSVSMKVSVTKAPAGSPAYMTTRTSLGQATTSYTLAGNATIQVQVPAGRTAKASITANYDMVGAGSGRMQAYVMYRSVTDNGTFTQLGDLIIGGTAYDTGGTEPERHADSMSGVRAAPVPTDMKIYEFQVYWVRTGTTTVISSNLSVYVE